MSYAEVPEELSRRLSGLRESLEADGAGLRVVELAPPVLRIEIVIGEAACANCILADDLLEQIVLSELGGSEYAVTAVEFERSQGTH